MIIQESDSAILQVLFHPLSQHHLCILYESGYIEVRKFNFDELQQNAAIPEAEQMVAVGHEREYISFCFAEPTGWGLVGVYLLARDGSVSTLSPVLPYHAPVRTEVLQQLIDTLPALDKLPECSAGARSWLQSIEVLSADNQPILQHLFADPDGQFVVIRKPPSHLASYVPGVSTQPLSDCSLTLWLCAAVLSVPS